MSPTIVLRNGKPVYAVGSPGGATIITTVLQTLVNRIDLGLSLPEAVAAPRASDRNLAPDPTKPGVAAVRAERAVWEHRVALLKSDQIDRDLLEERARIVLGRVHANDVVIIDP